MKLHKPQLVHEQRILVLALVAGAPAVLTSMLMLWLGDHTPKVQWTLTVLIMTIWLGFCFGLRERREDISALAAHFLGVHARRYRKDLRAFDQPAMQALLDNPWQGNVRELNHVVERAVLLAQDTVIRNGDLALRSGPQGAPRLDDMSLEDVEAFLIKKALARYNGNVSHAANGLGLSRSALYRRLQRYGL